MGADYGPGTKIPETDSVLTTGEVNQLIESYGSNLSQGPEELFEDVSSPSNGKQIGCTVRHGVSGTDLT